MEEAKYSSDHGAHSHHLPECGSWGASPGQIPTFRESRFTGLGLTLVAYMLLYRVSRTEFNVICYPQALCSEKIVRPNQNTFPLCNFQPDLEFLSLHPSRHGLA